MQFSFHTRVSDKDIDVVDPQLRQKKTCVSPVSNLLYRGEVRIHDLCVRKGWVLITPCPLNGQVNGAQSSFTSSLLHSLEAGNPLRVGNKRQRPGGHHCGEAVFSL